MKCLLHSVGAFSSPGNAGWTSWNGRLQVGAPGWGHHEGDLLRSPGHEALLLMRPGGRGKGRTSAPDTPIWALPRGGKAAVYTRNVTPFHHVYKES